MLLVGQSDWPYSLLELHKKSRLALDIQMHKEGFHELTSHFFDKNLVADLVKSEMMFYQNRADYKQLCHSSFDV